MGKDKQRNDNVAFKYLPHSQLLVMATLDQFAQYCNNSFFPFLVEQGRLSPKNARYGVGVGYLVILHERPSRLFGRETIWARGETGAVGTGEEINRQRKNIALLSFTRLSLHHSMPQFSLRPMISSPWVSENAFDLV